MTEKKGNIFVFSAPSGSGKSTIVRNVLSNHPDFVFSISATTRKRRENEVEGKHYFFISEEEFESKIHKNEFIEWERFYDYYYGTLKSFVDNNIDNGYSVVLEVDVKGALSIKNIYSDAVLIFISPPGIEELKERLIGRKTDTEEDIKKRIERAEMELSYKEQFDYCVINDELNLAIEKVENIIDKVKKGVKL